MANIEKIEVRIEREETKLKSQLQRKQELESQIKETQKRIEDLKAEVQYKKMSHASNVASEFDVTPEDWELAMVTGDFSIIQEKRQKALEAKAALEASAVGNTATADTDTAESPESVGENDGEEERPE